MPENTKTMKENLLGTVGALREDEINLEETPVVFRWSYPEEPHIEFQLMITELLFAATEAEGSEVVH